MSEWTCPACGGGFPQEAMLDGTACPWCEFMLGEAAELREAGHFDVVDALGGADE